MLDTAISPSCASRRGVSGSVAGRADVLVVPDVESGNIMGKGIPYLAGGSMAGVVSGALVPPIVGSRSDPVKRDWPVSAREFSSLVQFQDGPS